MICLSVVMAFLSKKLAKPRDAIRRASPGGGSVGTEELADLVVRELGEVPVDHRPTLLGRQCVQTGAELVGLVVRRRLGDGELGEVARWLGLRAAPRT